MIGSDPALSFNYRQVGTVRRIVREPDRIHFIWIPVIRCEEDGRYHRVLPDFLLPFKHYTVNTISAAVNDNADLDLYDLPSDSSRIRWKRSLPNLLPNAKSSLFRSFKPLCTVPHKRL